MLFCSGGFESVSWLFLSRLVHTMRLASYDLILLYYHAETKEMISESVSLRDVYEPKQKSFSLQSSPHVHVLQTLARSFVHSLNSELFFNWIK